MKDSYITRRNAERVRINNAIRRHEAEKAERERSRVEAALDRQERAKEEANR